MTSVLLPANTVLAALLRDGRPLTPSSDDVFEAGDELLVLIPDADSDAVAELRRMVNPEPAQPPQD